VQLTRAVVQSLLAVCSHLAQLFSQLAHVCSYLVHLCSHFSQYETGIYKGWPEIGHPWWSATLGWRERRWRVVEWVIVPVDLPSAILKWNSARYGANSAIRRELRVHCEAHSP
jgi:hypothetical protein